MGLAQSVTTPDASQVPGGVAGTIPNPGNAGNVPVMNGNNQQPSVEDEGRGKKKSQFHGRGKGLGAVPKGRGPPAPGWTGSGFDVDGRN